METYKPMPIEDNVEFRKRADEEPQVCPICDGLCYTEQGMECPRCEGTGELWN